MRESQGGNPIGKALVKKKSTKFNMSKNWYLVNIKGWHLGNI